MNNPEISTDSFSSDLVIEAVV